MPVYELSIDNALIRQAERLVSLEGRGYPTLVMRWESRIFEQPWTTTIVLDYAIALPPLMVGQSTFNDVRIAAFVDGAGTKFLYFGTEMTGDVPRVGPEMENVIGPARVYQEFRLEEQTCPVPYLKLIQTTPRIYGNGPQDYYSPPVKVERYDGVATADLLADFFPTVVAGLDCVKGSVLTDPAGGLWTGARFAGVTSIAILRAGKVVGLHRRIGRTDRDAPPKDVVMRDPQKDVRKDIVAIDLGARSTVVAVRGEKGPATFVRVGSETSVPRLSSDFENPTEIAFLSLGPTLKAWRDRVILPLTRWEDVVVGHAARGFRTKPGPDRPSRAMATLTELPVLRERSERRELVRLRGHQDPDAQESLKKPAPPIVDEEGIGAHDPFDPLELYAYHLGLHLNQRSRGIFTRYAVTMPTGLPPERRQALLVALRKGIYRSLPAGLVEFHDLERLEVVDAGPSAVAFAAHAFRAFGIQCRGEPVPFGVVEAGASETAIVFGLLRDPSSSEKEAGSDRVIEYLTPVSIPWLGGERLLARLAYRLYAQNEAVLVESGVPFERPEGESGKGEGELFAPSPEARANVSIVKDLLRPLLAGEDPTLPPAVRLATLGTEPVDLSLAVDLESLRTALAGWVAEGVERVLAEMREAIGKISRKAEPYEGLHLVLGGRFASNPLWAEGLSAGVPKGVKVHRYLEPDKANIAAPTVKTATALGVLSLRLDRTRALPRSESRDVFRFRVGRARHGQLADVLDPAAEYDAWREMGACTKPYVEILYMSADDDGEVAADDPRVMRAGVRVSESALGQRLYLRAVGPFTVQLATGPAGGEPAEEGPHFQVDLRTSVVERVDAR